MGRTDFSMPHWQTMRLDYGVQGTGLEIRSQQTLAYSDHAVPQETGKLVTKSMRRLGGNERPLFWARTAIPAYLGLVSTGNIIRPAAVITNDPVMLMRCAGSLKIKVGGEEYPFGIDPIQHEQDKRDQHINRYLGTIAHTLTTSEGFPGDIMLLHCLRTDCDADNSFITGQRRTSFSELMQDLQDMGVPVERIR